MNKNLYTIKKRVLKDSLAYMQHFKFVNWRICHKQVIRDNINALMAEDVPS